MPAYAVQHERGQILFQPQIEGWDNSLLQRDILFSFKGHLLPALAFFLSGREGEVEISQHALFIVCDQHKLSAGNCWGPASECVCVRPCLQPKHSLLTYTHSQTHTQQHADKQENPLCPQS